MSVLDIFVVGFEVFLYWLFMELIFMGGVLCIVVIVNGMLVVVVGLGL